MRRAARAPSASATRGSASHRRVAPSACVPEDAVEPRGHNWSSPSWQWGYAVGDAHDAAAELRGRLDTNVERAKWIGACNYQPAGV